MAFKSVIWTARTPVSWDRLQQMSDNIEYIRGTTSRYSYGVTYSTGTTPVFGYKLLTTPISNVVAETTVLTLSSIRTSAGRLYRLMASLPSMTASLSGSTGSYIVRMKRDGTEIATFIDEVGSGSRGVSPTFTTLENALPTGSYTYTLTIASWYGTNSVSIPVAGDKGYGYFLMEDIGRA